MLNKNINKQSVYLSHHSMFDENLVRLQKTFIIKPPVLLKCAGYFHVLYVLI